LKKPELNPYITQLSYKILLSLNKSKGYEGVVKIRIVSANKLSDVNLYIDTIASTILFVAINGRRVPEDEIIFRDHHILIKK
jgi:hypothetical protein